MKLIVNGVPGEHEGEPTVLSLLQEKSADSRRVAVMVNERIVRRGECDGVRLQPGDRIEIVAIVGGG